MDELLTKGLDERENSSGDLTKPNDPRNDRQTTRSKTMKKFMERETTSARRISAPDPRHMTAFSICGHMAGVAASFAGDLVRPLGSPDHQIRSSETSVPSKLIYRYVSDSHVHYRMRPAQMLHAGVLLHSR